MTREESLEYRRSCPYDAMGDYSFLFQHDKDNGDNKETEDMEPAAINRQMI